MYSSVCGFIVDRTVTDYYVHSLYRTANERTNNNNNNNKKEEEEEMIDYYQTDQRGKNGFLFYYFIMREHRFGCLFLPTYYYGIYNNTW